MPRRIEVELTSRRDDDTWTWRAAGAKEPKGVLAGSLLFDGADVGDVVRAETEIGIDGIEVIGVLPPKERRPEPERIEMLGSGPAQGGVTTSLVGKAGDSRRSRDGRGKRRKGDRPPRGEKGRDRRERRERSADAPPPPSRPKPKRLRPGRAHRNEWLGSLPTEQQPVAEQLVRGGMAAVRKEIDAEIEKAREEGRPEIHAEPLVAMAEELLPKLRQAEWQDRAEAALDQIDEIDLRDLRSVVVAADDFARTAEARELADQLRTGLSTRVEAAQKEWLDEIGTLLADGRVVRALRVSSRPPKAGEPMPGELAQRLADAANESLRGEVTQQRMAVVIDAVAFSPVRQKVDIDDVPANPTDELLQAVGKVAQHVPQIAARFGLEPTPAKRPRRPPPPTRSDGPPPSDRPPASVAEPQSEAEAGTGG